MVRAFLSIITIIHHPSSIIHHRFWHDKYWSKENDSAIPSFGIRAFCARPFFSLTFNTFLHFSVCFFMHFNTWFSPFLRTHNEIGSRMWFLFSIFYTKIHCQ